MDERSVQIATICECIDHCFAFAMWRDDFARHVDAEDMVNGLDRAFDLVSDATRLYSFLALRKLDDFFGGVKLRADDLAVGDFEIDGAKLLSEVGEKFLSTAERENTNKGVVHLTDRLSLDPDSEVDLAAILKRSLPVFSRLVSALREADTAGEARHSLDRTDGLIKRMAVK